VRNFIRLHDNDNVVIALKDLEAGLLLAVADKEIRLTENIKQGHKIAVVALSQDAQIIKYGFPIGHATAAIKAGAHVHTHNLKTNLGDQLTYSYTPDLASALVAKAERQVQVYQRANGEVGIRNELWIVPTVGCVNKTAARIKDDFLASVKNLAKNVDGVFVFEHDYGCSQMGDDHETTKKILQNIVKHPNAGAVLVVGLGCENNQIAEFRQTLGEYDKTRIRFLVAQEPADEILAGVEVVSELYEIMKNDQRTPAPLKNLRIGLECGGSDGFSGITANPLLGFLSDYLVSHGATTVLTEVPEMFGAETILMNRCESREIFEKTVRLINDFKQYYEDNNQVCYENPSPGNKDGGITTLEDKSLGCTQKAGTSNVVDVLFYTDRLKKNGLNLLQGPGNDLVATTALGAAGCHMVLFTTGRGTPYGGFVPTVKIATNTPLAKKKPHWIDYDAGMLLTSPPEAVTNDFIDYIIEVCNGKWTHNEKHDYRELAIWKFGVTL